jgi:hypothetical protein
MFKDIGYLLRSPLAIALYTSTIWNVVNTLNYTDISFFIIIIIISSLVGLTICYLMAFLLSKFFKIPSYNDLPKLLKYEAIYFFVISLGLPFDSFRSMWDLFQIVPFALCIKVGTWWIDMILSLFFYNTDYKKEWAFSFGIISSFVALIFVKHFGLLWGSVFGIISIVLLPFIITGFLIGILNRLYLLLGIQLYIVDQNNKWLLNPKWQNSDAHKDFKKFKEFMSNLKIEDLKIEIIAKQLEERINHLYKIQSDLQTFDFDNNTEEFSASIAEYRRWKNEILKYILENINREEEIQLENVFSVDLNSSAKYRLLKREIISIQSHFIGLLTALSHGKIQILPMGNSFNEEMKDVFICHTSADKMSYVEPLLAKLKTHNISYWYDKSEIKWGDSIVRKVSEGFRHSKFVIVVLSKNSFGKNWARNEMEAALNIEFSSGKIKVLPLLIGTQSDVEEILEHYPLLRSKSYLKNNMGLD